MCCAVLPWSIPGTCELPYKVYTNYVYTKGVPQPAYITDYNMVEELELLVCVE